MAYRVIQWTTGNVGRAALQGILLHPQLELVGVCITRTPRPRRRGARLLPAVRV